MPILRKIQDYMLTFQYVLLISHAQTANISITFILSCTHHHIIINHHYSQIYNRFEALEYCGLLKEARREENKQLIAQSRDYVLRSIDSIRHDIRTQLHPSKISSRVKRSMKKDKPGTVGFGTGAFLGFAL